MLVTTRRFLARDVDALEHDRAGRISTRAMERAREIGLFGLAIPEAWGGLGLGLRQVCSVVAEIARVDRALATTVGLHNGLGTRALIELGASEVKDRWLPILARGERLAAFAATEPGAGSDLAAVRTTVRRVARGLRVDGEKAYVTNAAQAGVLTVLARAAERAGRTSALVLVPRDADGVDVGPEERKMGLRASSTCGVRFDRVVVGEDHALSGRGLDDAQGALAWGRVLLSAGCLGTVRAALERSLDHARRRRQFGRALVELGAVRHHLASMAAAEATIASVLEVACAAGAELAVHAGALKVLASELAGDACDRAVQIHGAMGYLEDPGVAILARDCRVTRIFEGANEVLLLRHGTGVLAGRGLARAGALRSGRVAAQVCDVIERLERAALDARITHGVAAVRHHALLLSLARADVWLHAALCAAEASRRQRAQSVVLAHAGRRALAEADRALDRADLSDLDARLEDDVIEMLVRPPSVEPCVEAVA